jgi:hypothetical protein
MATRKSETPKVKTPLKGEGYCVEALDNDLSGFSDVIKVLMKFCGCDEEKAEHYAQRINDEGCVACFWGTKYQCEVVIGAFKEIGVECNLVDC